jgi:uncharacterized SAM-binding protein YcdF (DUF218 family)
VNLRNSTSSIWCRRLRFVERRAVWCPTLFGWFCLVLLLVLPCAWWFIYGESFLSSTRPLPAEVLVVESWIGYAGIRAAAAEFKQQGYQYIVTTGGMTDERWSDHRSSYAQMGERELSRSGVPSEKIIVAPATDSEKQRTFGSAAAVFQALKARGIRPSALNVFTLGPHARRSLLVFAKVNDPGTKVGAVGWAPPGDEPLSWWQSSKRAKEFMSETAAYVYELLLNSGRISNSAGSGASTNIVQHSHPEPQVATP